MTTKNTVINISDSPSMSIEDQVKLLEPLIDITRCDRISLRQLRLNHKEIISKLQITGKPVLLRINQMDYPLCDIKGYLELEHRRQCVLSRCKTAEEILKTRKIDFPDPQLQEVECLRTEIADTKDRLINMELEIQKTRNILIELENRKTAIINSMKAKNDKQAN
jgi:hypothetical protein